MNNDINTEIKNDAVLNGAFGLVDGVSNGLKTTNNMSKLKNVLTTASGGITGGIIAGIPGTAANYYGSKASDALYKKYSKEDQEASLGHAALISAPMMAGTTYGIGAMMHGMDHSRDLFKSKNLKEFGKNLGHIVNPWEHAKRGVKEIKGGFDAFNTAKKMSKFTRFLKGTNLIGLGLSLMPGAMYYFSKKKQEKGKDVDYNKLNNINNVAGGTQKLLTKSAGYVPFYTAIKNIRQKKKEVQETAELYGDFKKHAPQHQQKLKELEKAKDDLANDAIGTGVLGAGLYMYTKKLSDNNRQQPNFGDM